MRQLNSHTVKSYIVPLIACIFISDIDEEEKQDVSEEDDPNPNCDDDETVLLEDLEELVNVSRF